ncbi:MAG: YicC/YloC family endoribonuclease [Cellulosilyticaceae bacterium]
MIRSMTGYGRCETEEDGHRFNLEISSVNHRYCDIHIRMPKSLNALEDKMRKMIKEAIGRGKVDVNLYYQSLNEEDVEIIINERVCRAYVNSLRKLGAEMGIQDNIGLAELMEVNDLVSIHKKSVDLEVIWPVVQNILKNTLDEIIKMREVEGSALKKDLLEKSKIVQAYVDELTKNSPRITEKYKEKLQNKLKQLLAPGVVDEMRLATEVAIFADRMAIDEELIRLTSHVGQLAQILEESGSVGRKLDFLMQEMSREANTIASKANDYDVTQYAVALKTEIEKMREQIQNIE